MLGWRSGERSLQAIDVATNLAVIVPKIDRLFGEGVSCLVRLASKAENRGGSVCESNTPATSEMPPAGFEDRESHRTPCASE